VAQAPSGIEALSALLEHAFRVGEVLPEELRELALQVGPAAHEAYMTAAQKLIAEGEARGQARGEAKGKAELLLRQLSLRFGTLSEAVRDQVLHAPSERLDVWAERGIAVQSLEGVLG
jgi:hypothetical protein